MKATTTYRKVGTLRYECAGCDNTAEVPVRVEIFTEPIGPTWVKVTTRLPKLPDLTPDGWMVSDPYTHLTYCPTCWALIAADVAEKAQA